MSHAHAQKAGNQAARPGGLALMISILLCLGSDSAGRVHNGRVVQTPIACFSSLLLLAVACMALGKQYILHSLLCLIWRHCGSLLCIAIGFYTLFLCLSMLC